MTGRLDVVALVTDVIGADPGAVLVSGDGPSAATLRQRFPGTPAEPNVVIETAGTTEGIQAAFEDVASLGTVVLVGPPPAGPPTLDLYGDVHVRGLTVVGVPTGD